MARRNTKQPVEKPEPKYVTAVETREITVTQKVLSFTLTENVAQQLSDFFNEQYISTSDYPDVDVFDNELKAALAQPGA